MDDPGTIPVTLLAGFLGSGKTTLVRRMLAAAAERGERVAVVVNEFGALGIDGDLIVREEGDGATSIVELAGGCICCEIQDDLRAALLDLGRALDRASGRRGLRWLRRDTRPVRRVLVEASGAASPGAAVQTLLADPEVVARMHLSGVVTLAHAALAEAQLASTAEAGRQIAHADRVLLNHCDRADEATVTAAESAILRVNPTADVRRAVQAEVDLDWVAAPRSADVSGAAEATGGEPHSAGLAAVSLESDAAVDPDALRIWLEFLSERRGASLMLVKGIVRAAGGGALEVQAIDRWLEIGRLAGDPPDRSRLVVIGAGLDASELERGWRAVQA